MERSTLMAILELARWAPSGDNSQPWTFRLAADDIIEIDCVDQGDTDVYDFDGRPTLLTLGFLIESMAIAASKFGAAIDWTYRAAGAHLHRVEVRVRPQPVAVDALLGLLKTRSVERGRYRRDPLTAEQKRSLSDALGASLALRWFETPAEKLAIARINARASHIRLSIPEAYAVHRRILDWSGQHSADGVPATAIGLDPLALRCMQWTMRTWQRVAFMNRFLGGTRLPQLEMDILPGTYCAAHFMVFQRPAAGECAPRLIASGRALQRFWLSATALGLVLQPSLAPLCFAWYAQHGRRFTADVRMDQEARAVRQALMLAAGARAGDGELVFMGRIGVPRASAPGPRSVRKPLDQLMG